MRLSSGGELVKPGDNATPWVITYRGPQGQTPELMPQYAIYKGCTIEKTDSSATMVFRWDTRLNYDGNPAPVVMKVTVSDKSDLLTWNL